MTQEKLLHSPEEMESFAAFIGARLRGGECIELSSDLGGGKTTFTRGVAKGAGSLDAVSSPTFTIGKQYRAAKVTIYHFDFYRLQEPGVVAEELAEAISDHYGVIIVEWAQTVQHVLPEDRVKIEIQKTAASDQQRNMIITAPDSLDYLFEEEK